MGKAWKVIPERPFDGKMKKLQLVISLMGAILVASLSFIAAFIYYFAVRHLHLTPLLLLIPTLFAEAVLLYVNNDARVKYKRYFMELNPIWSRLDKSSTPLSLVLHFCLVTGSAVLISLFMTEMFFFMFGMLTVNLLLDYVTVAMRVQCVKMHCPNLTGRVACLECMQASREQKPYKPPQQ